MKKEEETRKGPWTEDEDGQLVFYVNLLGDRRWDFIAKVSGLKVGGRYKFFIGLKRSGKSCRLRWVNYLHPGLKRGKITPQEECLIVELQSKWGNRWSKIARKLPGRTDNEIKNYWRALMRRKCQERKKTTSPQSTSSSSSSLPHDSSSALTELATMNNRSFYDTGGPDPVIGEKRFCLELEEMNEQFSMDDLWREFDGGNFCSLTDHAVDSTAWDYGLTDSLWSMDQEESKMLMQHQHQHQHQHQQPMGDDFYSLPFYNYHNIAG